MLRIIFIVSIFLVSVQSYSQSTADGKEITDNEQNQLEARYTYSNLLGFNIDTILNQKLYETIAEWLGTRYCYGGDSKCGVDCSGFVIALYKNAFELSLEGNANDLFKNSKPLQKSKLAEGDLVFFRIRKKRISHVGVYLGQNKFVHASLKQGVTIDDLNEPYYKKYFFRGGRIEQKLSVTNSK